MPQKPLTASTLVLDIVAGNASGRRTAQQICRAGALMGFSEPSVRVALTRLVQSGKIEKLARGSYALDTRRTRWQRDIETWRERVDWLGPWNGAWIMAADGTPIRDSTRARWHRRALALRGFRKWRPGLHARPDNLRGGVEAMRAQMATLGLSRGAELFIATGLDQGQVASLLGRWDVAANSAEHSRLLARAEEGLDRLSRLEIEEAARESLLLGRELIGAVLRDPLLPPELVQGVGIRKVAKTVAAYQDASREIWNQALSAADASA